MRGKRALNHKYCGHKGLWLRVVLLVLLTLFLASCGGGNAVNNSANYEDSANAPSGNNTGAEEPAPEDEEPAEESEDVEEPSPRPTASPQDRIEDWIVDLEWPSAIELGESDVIRLTMVPTEQGLVIEAEFADHQSTTQRIPIERPEGYLLTAVAELHAINFEITPEGPQRRELVIGKEETWYWTITPRQGGRQRMSLSLVMEWQAQQGQTPATRQFGSFAHGFEVQVISIWGMSRTNAFRLFAVVCVLLVVVIAFVVRRSFRASVIQTMKPNTNVRLEPQPEINLSDQEARLLQTIFREYRRVVVEKEFMSGYSGARTFMTIPVRQDQRADARTIIKLSDNKSIRREYHNYQRYVKNTLPPTTARIQQQPVTAKNSPLAALRYTFVGMPGESPLSLRLALLENPDPAWFTRLADAYGPNWWMQHGPYTFRVQQEYDRKLPAHLALRPGKGAAKTLDGRQNPASLDAAPGDILHLTHFRLKSVNPRLGKFSLVGEAKDGHAPIRVSYYGPELPAKITGVVDYTRQTFLKERTAGFDRLGLPDPLDRLSEVMGATMTSTRSVIHGDLNLENILVGPGSTLWLIDFAETREGHTLFDIAHLYVEVVAHILSQQAETPQAYVEGLKYGYPLLDVLADLARRYSFFNEEDLELTLAAFISCLGAQKYRNLDEKARYYLYLTAAYLAANI